jgi:DNA-binding NarL/FixJ family response regulator
LNGVGLLRELRQRHLPTAVIFYTGATHEVCMSEAVLAEPEGFVLKSDEISHLRQAITSICTGKRYWSPAVGELRAKIASTAERLARLTESEVQVLALLTAGRSTKEIASALYKSEHTISHQRQSLMDKLNLHNAVALANFARAAGVGE